MATKATTTPDAQTARDYLVVCSFGFGSGSWARDKDLETAVKRCRSIAYSDWKHLFKLDGVEVTLTLFDVTGQDRIRMDGDGVEGDNPDAAILNLGLRKVRFPKGSRR